MPETVNRNDKRDRLLTAFREGVRAADPFQAVAATIAYDGTNLTIAGETVSSDRFYMLAFGKAACAMIEGALSKIPSSDLAAAPIVVTNDENFREIDGCRVFASSHPLPDERGVAAAEQVAALLDQAQAGDVILTLVSGGGSALLPLPVPGIALREKIETTNLLLASGADITQINSIRKHLSSLKGGQMARRALPARLHTLILSDVIGDDLSAIASGPTVPDPTRYSDCKMILDQLGLWEKIPTSVQKHLQDGCNGMIPETPKPGDDIVQNTHNILIGSNLISLAAMEETLKRQGVAVERYSSGLEGEARVEAARLAAHAVKHRAQSSGDAIAFTAGGETTVTLSGNGLGGRNQEFALAFAIEAERQGLSGSWTLLSAGTDGRDGPTDAAGGLVDQNTLASLRDAGANPVDFLANNDAYHALDKASALIRIGGTGTNVADLVVLMM